VRFKTKPVIAGAVAGAALAAGGIVAIDLSSEPAEAQGGTTPAKAVAEARAASTRASAAIRKANTLNNNLGKYFVPAGVNIGAKNPPGVIRSDSGNGANGIPTETIQNRAITNAKLANESVNSEKIAPGGVTNGDLANEAVTSEKIAPGTLPVQKVAAPAGSTTPPAGTPTVLAEVDLSAYTTGYNWSVWGTARAAIASGTCRITDQNGTNLSSGDSTPNSSAGYIIATAVKTATDGGPTRAQLNCTGSGATTFEKPQLSVNVAPE
jgi:hypothetical protein